MIDEQYKQWYLSLPAAEKWKFIQMIASDNPNAFAVVLAAYSAGDLLQFLHSVEQWKNDSGKVLVDLINKELGKRRMSV